MERFFHLKERGTTVKTEVLAGLTTFMAMAYILMVNAGIFASLEVVSYNAIYIATAISAIVGTVLIGLMSGLPMAQAPGMGVNAFVVFTICFAFGFSYQNAMVMVLLDGIVFIILTVTGARKALFKAIPQAVKTIIPAGIGLFIAYIGLQNAKIIVPNESTASAFASLNFLTGTATWTSIMPILVTFFSIILIAVLAKKNVRGAVLIGILGGAAMYYALGFTIPGFYEGFFAGFSFNPFIAFKEFGDMAFLQVFKSGFDFSGYIAQHGTTNFVLVLLTTSLSLCIVDCFDTIGTLFGACARGNLLTENGEVPNMNKAMLADAIATCTGAMCGVSTVTTFVESSAGVAEGGKTGLTSLTTAALFLVAMFFAPLASLIPSCATAAALVYVGVLMMNGVRDVDWTDAAVAVPAFLSIVVMAFGYNISYGIGIGVIAYTLVEAFRGNAKEVHPITWVLDILFLAMFFLSH